MATVCISKQASANLTKLTKLKRGNGFISKGRVFADLVEEALKKERKKEWMTDEDYTCK